MHEMRVATEIIEFAQKEMLNRNLDSIKKIGMKIGALSCINPDSLRFCFEAATQETALADVALTIEYVPVDGVCKSCGEDFRVDDYTFICPSCGSNDIDIARGDECVIEYLEV
jgi:hydrogenase nickel incorporation protein HypA/HybF